MSKSLFPEMVKTKSPTILFVEVQEKIKKGFDLYTQPFISYEGEIVQYMVPGLCLYEYRLIEATELDELDDKVQGLAALGFDFMFGMVMWNGCYLQWMQRMNDTGLNVKEVLSESLSTGPLEGVNDLKMIVGVSPVSRWTVQNILEREG